MSTTTGNETRIFWGFQNLSAIGSQATNTPSLLAIDKPSTFEENHRSQVPGSSKVDNMSVTITRQDLNLALLTSFEAQTASPMLITIRGTAGNLAFYSAAHRIASHPDSQSPDEWTSKEIGFAAGEGSQPRLSQGLLFDHYMAHLTGVTAPVAGTAVQVGAVSATQSVTVIWVNPHSPAPTVAGGVAQLESDDAQGFPTTTVRGVAFATITSTPSYEVQTIAGPITDDWWRINITAVTSGIAWPVGAIWIHDTI